MFSDFLLSTLCSGILMFSNTQECFKNAETVVTHNIVTDPQLAYHSEWETVPSWSTENKNGSLFHTYKRTIPQISKTILDSGVIVVFAKGYDFNGINKSEEKPLGLPFYMLSSIESLSHPQAWSFKIEEGNLIIGLSMHPEVKSFFDNDSKDIQLRYFVLSPEFLKKHNLTEEGVRKSNYNQIVSLIGTTP